MKFVGIDLHKKIIAFCVMDQERNILVQKTLHCCDTDKIVAFFKQLGAFQATIEATASYEWFWQLLEPLADRLVLAHPKKLRGIAESTQKTDRVDARILATFLALDMIPQAYRPTPRQRQHRVLVRQRMYIKKRSTAVRNKIRHVLSHHNADRSDLFTAEGLVYAKSVKAPAADRFVLNQLLDEWEYYEKQLAAANKQLKEFAKEAPLAEAEARELLGSCPQVGAVTVDVVVSEIGDIRRFRSAKKVVAYAGLAPGFRESAGRRKDLSISKDGSRLLRWALVEAAWRLVGRSAVWKPRYQKLRARCGPKKAIVAIARRLLCVMFAVWKSGQRYRLAA